MPSVALNTGRSPSGAIYTRASAFGEERKEPGVAAAVLRAAALAACLGLAGCGFAIPIGPLASDGLTTGSVTPAPPAPAAQASGAAARGLGDDLTGEDWRRASNALAVALDPLGNGERTPWDNPESGRSGAFRAAGMPYVRAGEVCRQWEGELRGAGVTRRLKGSACRAPGDEWRVASVSPV